MCGRWRCEMVGGGSVRWWGWRCEMCGRLRCEGMRCVEVWEVE